MMNKKVLTMAVMAAVCGMAVAPVWAANSGGTVNGDGKFVGNNGAAEAKAAEEAKKGEAEDVLKKLLASGMTAEEILAKLQ